MSLVDKAFDPQGFVKQVGADLIADFEKARRATTPTLVGSAMEQPTRRAFNSLLPAGLEIGSGCVIDVHGSTSRQFDVVLHESLCPVFCVNETPETTYFPCEGVVAVGEIKSRIGSREVQDVLAKVASLRKLKRQFGNTQHKEDRRGGERRAVTAYRHYNELKRDAFKDGVDPAIHTDGDILTFALTEQAQLSWERLFSLYQAASPDVPDILVALTGDWYSFSHKLPPTEKGRPVRNLTLDNPFGHLIHVVHQWFISGKTPEANVYQNYYLSLPALAVEQDWPRASGRNLMHRL